MRDVTCWIVRALWVPEQGPGASAKERGVPIIERHKPPALSVGLGRNGVLFHTTEVTMRTTQAVLESHLTCFGARDLDGILSDYAENAILFTPEGALKGPGEIKPLFERLLAEFGKPGASFSMKKMSVDGGYAYIIWSAETADNVYELATDTFVVRNGKIVVQSFAGKITPRN